MITPVIGFILLVIIALIGWFFAEAKADKISFNHSKEEAEGYEEMHEAFVSNECKELTLKDLLKRNYTKGYKSI